MSYNGFSATPIDGGIMGFMNYLHLEGFHCRKHLNLKVILKIKRKKIVQGVIKRMFMSIG